MSDARYVLSAATDTRYKAVLSWSYFGKAASYEVLYDGRLYTTRKTTLSFTGVAPGEHECQVRAIEAGSAAAAWSDVCAFEMADVTAPVMGKVSVNVIGGTATFSFNADDNVGVDHYLVECGTTRLIATDTQAVIRDLSVGKHSVSVIAYDAAGNVSKAATATFKVADYRAPDRVTGLGTEGTVTNKSGGNLTWSIPYDDSGRISRYRVTVDGKEYTTSKNTLKVTGLTAGDHTFTVVATDAAGFSSIVSDPAVFHVADVIKPTLGALSSVVNGVNVELNWSGNDETGIDHYLVSSVLGVEEVAAGRIDLVFRPEHVGKQKITVVAYDAAGNASTARSCTVKIADVTPPDPVTGLTAGIVTNKAGGVLQWDIPYDNSGKIVKYRVALDGKVYDVSTNQCKIGKLAAGEHTYTVIARDANGWWSAVSEPGVFMVDDVIAPKIGNCRAVVDRYRVGLSCVATDETGVAKYVISSAAGVVESASGETSITFAETDLGTQKITITALDAAGNASAEKVLTVKIADTTAPERVSGGIGAVTNKSGGTLMWEIPYDNSGKLGRYTVQLDGGTIFRTSAPEQKIKALSAGDHFFTVVATDAAGNASEVSEEFHFTVEDVIAPVIRSFTVEVGDRTARVSWEAEDETSETLRAELTLDGELLGETTADVWELADLSSGFHTLDLQVFDEAGNSAFRSRFFSIWRDWPIFPVVQDGDEGSVSELLAAVEPQAPAGMLA